MLKNVVFLCEFSYKSPVFFVFSAKKITFFFQYFCRKEKFSYIEKEMLNYVLEIVASEMFKI